MQSTTAMPEVPSRCVSRTSLWFGLIGGGIAWMIHLIAAYAIAEFGCVGRLGDRIYGNISAVAWMELALTAVAVSIGGAATVVSYRCGRRLQSMEATEPHSIADAFTARAGLLTSGILTFVIVFESIPIFFYLRSC